jgi:4-amino-4-deoxy-L-arabinose transferase-like glycosyltransferase
MALFMKKTPNNKNPERIFLFFILFASLLLFLGSLGSQCLWQDEAQTALVSKTILTDGVPRGTDGKNYFSQELGSEYGDNYIWKWHTWLSFYVLAAFYKLFGISTFVARLPFALFGIGSVFMSYLLCRAMWEDKKIAYTAALLLVTCVPFILLSRQCRYYSMTAFLSLWGLYSYVKILEGRKHAYITFFLASVFLFHTNYVYCAPLFFSVLLHALLFYRNKLLMILFLAGIVILINIPWIVWLSGIKYTNTYELRFFDIEQYLGFQNEYIRQMCTYVFTPYLLLAVPAAAIMFRIKKQPVFSGGSQYGKMLCLLIFFAASTIATLSFVSPAAFFRYLCPIVPVFIIFTACLVVLTGRIHFSIPIIIIALIIIISPMKDFIYELTHDYQGPIDGIVKYLNEHGSKDDIVAITYGDMPLKFYTNMRIIGGLTGEDLSDARKAKWVIMRKYSICKRDERVKNYLLKNLSGEDYEKIIINYPDIPFENREELTGYHPKLMGHHFRTVTDEDRVVIHRKIRNVDK